MRNVFGFTYVYMALKYIFSLLFIRLIYQLKGDSKLSKIMYVLDRLCGLVVRVSGYRYRGLGFDSRPLSLVRSIEELLE